MLKTFTYNGVPTLYAFGHVYHSSYGEMPMIGMYNSKTGKFIDLKYLTGYGVNYANYRYPIGMDIDSTGYIYTAFTGLNNPDRVLY